MIKYSLEERIEAVQTVMEGESIASVARRYGISRGVIGRDVMMLERQGTIGLNRHTATWSAEQKVQVLKFMHEFHLTCQEASRQWGISGSSTVWKWEQKYLENGIEGLERKKKDKKPRGQKPKPPKTRLEELEEENLDLRIENEYLKKLNALVAEREKRESGNR
jgi:transposase